MKKLLLTVMFMTSLFSDDSVVQPIPTEKIQHTTLFGPIKDIDVSTDGKFVVMGSLGGNIFIQDLEDKNTISILHTTLDDITSIDLSKDMTTIIAGDIKGQVEIWNLTKKTLVRKIDGHTKKITSVSISDDNTRVMSASNHESVKLWNLQTGALITTIQSLGEKVEGSYPERLLTRIIKNKAISFFEPERFMEVHDVNTGEKIGKVNVFDENVDPDFRDIPTTPGFMKDYSTAFSEDGNTLFVGTMDEETLDKDCFDRNRSCNHISYCIKAIDVKSNKLKFKIQDSRSPLTITKDGKYLVLVDTERDKNNRKIWRLVLKKVDIVSGKIDIYVLYESNTSIEGYFRERQHSPFKIREISNGKFIGLTSDGEVNMWDINR
jgi:WD40 repeat protein